MMRPLETSLSGHIKKADEEAEHNLRKDTLKSIFSLSITGLSILFLGIYLQFSLGWAVISLGVECIAIALFGLFILMRKDTK